MSHPLSDVVVVLPGVMGSSLRDGDGHEVWGTSMGTIVKGVLTRGKAIKRLALPSGIGDEPASDGVVAAGLMPDIHVIPGLWSVSIGYDAMVRWFRSKFELVEEDADDRDRAANFIQFSYDWRLSNRASARALQWRVEPALERFRASGHPDAKVVFVGHSMGGLVARYYVDVLGGHAITRKVVTMGTPHRGALNALATLVNGISKGWGPLKIDLTAFARSLPSLHQLLPEYACIESATGLLKTTQVSLPDLSTAAVADAMRFHEELRIGAATVGGSYQSHPLLAHTQPTDTTARIVDRRVETMRTIEGDDQKGDGTVPRLSAVPYGYGMDDPIVRHVMDKHGALPANDPALVELEGVLTATSVIPKPVEVDVGVACDDVLVAGERLNVVAETEPDLVVDAVVKGESSEQTAKAVASAHGDGTYTAEFDDLAPGRYVVQVGVRGMSHVVTTPLVVLAGVEPD